MNRLKSLLPWTVAIAAVVMSAIQFNSLQQLHSEMTAVRHRLDQTEASPVNLAQSSALTRREATGPADFRTDQRLATLEKSVARLVRSAEHLMERGQLPFGEEKLAELLRRFADPAQTDRERLRALQMLRRNGALTDDVAFQAVAWLTATTNATTQRSLLQQLDGATNAVLKQPLLSLASAGESRVREEAVDALSGFASDPQVQEQLWKLLTQDPDEGVREEAEQALRGGPFPETRLADLQKRAADPQASLAERLTALRLLDRASADTSAATASLAELAQNTTDAALRRELFRAFDRVEDPVVKLPLVYGLQDPNPLVREQAVDALADFRSDPAVEKWLQYVSENDADPQVRREAYEALMADD